MNLIPVVSSNIAAVGYDAIQNILYVQFKGRDTVYEYRGVDWNTYDEMIHATSIGSYYARNIKKQYAGNPVGESNGKS